MPNDERHPRPIRVALSNDHEIALLGLAGMLARNPEQVQTVDLTARTTMTHEPEHGPVICVQMTARQSR